MELSINSYIKKLLKKADYEYDKQTKSWCANVDDLPGAYAQANTKKEVKERLAEVVEDYVNSKGLPFGLIIHEIFCGMILSCSSTLPLLDLIYRRLR